MPAPRSSPSPSSQRAKLRSPANRADRLSFTSSSSTSKTQSHYSQLPATIQYLDQLSLSMVVDRPDSKKPKDIRYVLLVHKKDPRGLQWRVSRTYEDYRALQKKLLSVMQLGHFCNAECPWLYSFVKSHFPKECRFYSYTKYVVRKRLEALTNCFHTLLAHVLKRENHCCAVVTQAVAMELINFINEDLPEDSEVRWSQFSSTTKSSSSSSSSDENGLASLPPLSISIRSTPDRSELNNNTTRSARSSRSSECSLCSPSHHRALKSPVSVDENPERSHHSEDDEEALCEVDLSGSSLMALSCGHQFHDECIVPRLNEKMQCPTCGHAQAFC
ncbi:hypothetical protein Gpo141_00010720 [Globisporangium polare]